jgi:hypothetical protein
VNNGVSIAADPIVEIVGGDEQDIQLAPGRGGGGEPGERGCEGQGKQFASGKGGGHCLRIQAAGMENKLRELRNHA